MLFPINLEIVPDSANFMEIGHVGPMLSSFIKNESHRQIKNDETNVGHGSKFIGGAFLIGNNFSAPNEPGGIHGEDYEYVMKNNDGVTILVRTKITNTSKEVENPIKKTDISVENIIESQENGRGSLILVLGLFSFLFGLFLGIPAWVMGNVDLKKIKTGIIPSSEKRKTKAGMILGIINTLVIPVIIIIVGIVITVINVSTASSTQANRDAIIADCSYIASMSQQYYRKPAAMGGGNQSFEGYTIHNSLKETPNGEYSLKQISSQSLLLLTRRK